MKKRVFCSCVIPHFTGTYFCINCLKEIHRLFEKRKGYKKKQDEDSSTYSSMEKT